jgi:hypothetical protein
MNPDILSFSIQKVPASKFPAGSPVKQLSPEAHHTESLQRATLHFYSPFIYLSKSPVDEPPSMFPNWAPIEIDARLQSLSYLSSRVPSKGALPPGSLHRAVIERDASPPELLSAISQSPR